MVACPSLAKIRLASSTGTLSNLNGVLSLASLTMELTMVWSVYFQTIPAKTNFQNYNKPTVAVALTELQEQNELTYAKVEVVERAS